jgi:hypothetical protein
VPGQQQHVDFFRKKLLRKRLLVCAESGSAYVPFVGDGDLASELYRDRFVLGADTDAQRIATVKARGLNGDFRVFDCDQWPFGDIETGPIAVADFDSYNEPYPSFRSFWKCAEKSDRLVMFFTDGHKMGMTWSGYFVKPDGSKEVLRGEGKLAKAPHINFYFLRYPLPYVTSVVTKDGFRVVRHMVYLRGLMVYWGLVVERV